MSEVRGTPRTWFSGRSAPEDRRGPSLSTVVVFAATLVSPIGVLTSVVGYSLFALARLSWKAVAGTTAAYALGWVLLGGASGPFLAEYAAPWRHIVEAVQAGDLAQVAADSWPQWLWAQAPLSLLLGGAVAALTSWWKWIRRPSWERYDRRPGPVDVARRVLTRRAIGADRRGPDDGLTLGVTQYGHRVVQHDSEGSAHTMVAGGSGSGKTTTILLGLRDAIRMGRGVVVVDLKGGPDVPEQLAQWADRYGRRFLHWSIADPSAAYTGPADGPAFYDPIGRGDPSRRKDLIIGSQKWDVEHYKRMAAEYLQVAFKVAAAVPSGKESLGDLLDLLTPKTLRARAMGSQDEALRLMVDEALATDVDQRGEVVFRLEDTQQSAIRTLAVRLREIYHSTAGAWLKRDPLGRNDIDLRRAADEGWVVVFSLDSSNYEEGSAQIAGLIIQDLKTLSSELRRAPSQRPLHVVVDEFAAVGSDNILGLLNKARDAGMRVTLSTQALADLTRADPAFEEQVLGIIGCFVIHRANTEEDSRVFAGLTGKHMVFRKQYGIEMTSGIPGGVGTGAATGQGYIREEEEYRVLPSAFQDLQPGQLVYIAKSPRTRVLQPVTVVREDPAAVAARALSAPADGGHPAVTSRPGGPGTGADVDPQAADASGHAPHGKTPTNDEGWVTADDTWGQQPTAPAAGAVDRRTIAPVRFDPAGQVVWGARADTRATPPSASTPPPAPVALPRPAPEETASAPPIDPMAMRSRALSPALGDGTPVTSSPSGSPAAPAASTPAASLSSPAATTPAPAPVPVRPAEALPLRRPAPLTAPWLSPSPEEATDELGAPLTTEGSRLPEPGSPSTDSVFDVPTPHAVWVAAQEPSSWSEPDGAGPAASHTERHQPQPLAAQGRTASAGASPRPTSAPPPPSASTVAPSPSAPAPAVPTTTAGPSPRPGPVFDEKEW